MGSILKHTTKWILIAVYALGSCAGPQKTVPAVSQQQINSYPLRSVDDLDVLLDEIGNARIVLLGEASHGTAEYYNWRAAISKRLISEKGFNLIAVEGDYIDMYWLDQCVRGELEDTSINHVLSGFNRWPQWLWYNVEFADFAQWLKNHNANSLNSKVKLCGLDVFNFAGALNHIVAVLDDTAALYQVKRMQECIRPFGGDALRYSGAISKGTAACNADVYRLWQAIQNITGGKIDNVKELLLVQHALVVMNGENISG